MKGHAPGDEVEASGAEIGDGAQAGPQSGSSEAAAQTADGAETPIDEPDAAGLIDDLRCLVDDALVYGEAEIAYRKIQGRYLANRSGALALLVLGALALVHLALFALVVGALIALIPALGPFGAIALVFGVLLAGAALLLLLARRRLRQIARALGEQDERSDGDGKPGRVAQ